MNDEILLRAAREDLADLVLVVVLATVAVGLLAVAYVGRGRARRELALAGAFALMYAARLLLVSAWGHLWLGDPQTLELARSALEYLVPIPGALLLTELSVPRLRSAGRSLVALFALLAVVGIPYEVLAGRPYAAMGIANLLVYGLVAVFSASLILGGPTLERDRRALTIGGAVFMAFVLNEHFGWRDRWEILTEPLGFLVFIGTIGYVAIRRAARDEADLIAIRRELETASAIQRALIPERTPGVPGLHVEALYRPASDVGGDFYDFVELSDGRLGVFVADVSGHGVPAALLASMLKMALRNQRGLADRPGNLLAGLDRDLRDDVGRRFVTAIYAVFDPATNTATVAGAGHPAALLLRADGSRSEVASTGPVLGRLPRPRFRQVEIAFGPSDALLLLTDGLVEALDGRGELFGEARVGDTLAAGIRDPDARPLDALVAAALRWSGHRQLEDDVTLVLVQRVPAG